MIEVNDIPKVLYAGSKLDIVEDNSTYTPNNGYTLKYTLINSSAKIALSSEAYQNAHRFTVASSTSADWTAGTYNYQKYVEHTDGTIIMLDQGTVEVKTFFTGQSTYDGRSENQQVLDLLRAAYKKVAATGHTEISMPDGRSVKYDRTQLIKEIHNYEQKVKLESGATSKSRINFRINY